MSRNNGIYDNNGVDVGSVINQFLVGSNSVKIGVGYFFMSGFDVLVDNLEEVDDVQLIIGSDTSGSTKEAIEKCLNENVTHADGERVRRFYQFVNSDYVSVRVYDEKMFHPKIYIFEQGDDVTGIVGSSNLSHGGLEDNVELNVEVDSQERAEYLRDWFDERWDESSCVDVDVLNDVLEENEDVFSDSFSVCSPLDVTVDYVYSQFSDEIDDGVLFDDIESDYEEVLATFQNDAVRASRRPIEKYGGVLLSDSVGLGKSYIGGALVKEYVEPGDTVLVVTPLRLEEMWCDEIFMDEDKFKLPSSVNIEYLSYHDLSRVDESGKMFYDVDIVLIDEAHKLRNTSSKRHKNMQYIGNDMTKFVLLTATPINNSIKDMRNIVQLFANSSDFSGVLGGQTLSFVFNTYHKLSSKDVLSNSDRERLDSVRDDIQSVMEEVVISRDRSYIEENYDDVSIGDQEIKVPDRITKQVSLGDSDVGNVYDAVVDMIFGDSDRLNIPYVSMERYGEIDSKEEELNEKTKFYGTTSLMLINLLKRLESSFEAFKKSIDNLIEQEEKLKQLVKNKQAIEAGDESVGVYDGIDTIDFDEIEEVVSNLTDEQRERVILDIEEDLKDLNDIRDEAFIAFHQFDAYESNDTKANKLKHIINNKVSSGEKVVVFTQFTNTLDRLFEVICSNKDNEEQLGVMENNQNVSVAKIYGGDGFDKRLIERFAPIAQDVDDVENSDEIDVLLATDVIGAGQNLQDCSVIVNYDLRWNPMMMEQRIGRIDRITTNHDELHIYNFIPSGELSDRLNLLDTLQNKIKEISDTFGHSSPIINSAEERIQKSIISTKEMQDGEYNSVDSVDNIQSTYESFRSSVRHFCETKNITINKLQQNNIDETTLFTLPETNGNIFLLVNITYNNKENEWVPVVFNDVAQSTLFGEVSIKHIEKESVDIEEIFNTISSSDKTVYPLNTDERKELEFIVEKLSDTETWVTHMEHDEENKIDEIKEWCNVISNKVENTELAKENYKLLSKNRIGDWGKKELNKLYRMRNQNGINNTIEQINNLLTNGKIKLLKQKTITNIYITACGYV